MIQLLRFVKYILLLLAAVLITLTVIDIFTINSTHTHFLGYFKQNLKWHISVLKILAAVVTFVFIFFVVPNIWTLVNPFRPTTKKQFAALIILCFYCAITIVPYLSNDHRSFDASGQPLTCVAWALDHYDTLPCYWKTHPDYGTEVDTVDARLARLLALKKIEVNENTLFFDPLSGKPRVYYYLTPKNKLEFFNGAGIHPVYGDTLLPVTKEIIKQYFIPSVKSNETSIKNNTISTSQQKVDTPQQMASRVKEDTNKHSITATVSKVTTTKPIPKKSKVKKTTAINYTGYPIINFNPYGQGKGRTIFWNKCSNCFFEITVDDSYIGTTTKYQIVAPDCEGNEVYVDLEKGYHVYSIKLRGFLYKQGSFYVQEGQCVRVVLHPPNSR